MKNLANKPYQNAYGCTDLTAFRAIKNVEREARRNHATEAQEQEAIFQWASLMEKRYPLVKRLHACPNGEYRPKAVAAKLKRQGVKAGIPDMCLPVPMEKYHGLYIELKTKTGRLSDRQAEFLSDSKRLGYAAFECHGASEAIRVLEWYLAGAK